MRTAEEPGQSLNIDLCFVPATHTAATRKLPAVSGSSGRLVIERPREESSKATWPGHIFEDPQVDYVEAVMAFVEASRSPADSPVPSEPTDMTLKTRKRALREEETQLRASRRTIRQKRREEDRIWHAMRQLYRTMAAAQPPPSKDEQASLKQAQRALRQHRKTTLTRRHAEDLQWRQQRQSLRARWAEFPIMTAWIAILVMTDNCTRQCPGLPVFVAGSHVTADVIVEALEALLPPNLRFLITDRGIHFRANVLQALARRHQFIHVMIARHRPQSNGIAERFVRTLKEWLFEASWGDEQELTGLLEQFVAEYNERPHQGLPIPGLSPKEFTNRFWLY